MCTLSVITRDNGYLLAMNRDERVARSAGEIPEIHQLDGTRAIYPSDGVGGTWIAANEYGITLALLNWNNIVRRHVESGRARSRGRIIPALGSSSALAELRVAVGELDLGGIMPFRLVGVFPSEQSIGEWCWDSLQLTSQLQSWHCRHWFSSSLSDIQAERLRGAACRNAEHQSDAGSAPWLRRLHASHWGAPGPFSLCVHRDDVKSLSYTEVMVAPGDIQINHFRGSPCDIGTTAATGMDRIEHARSTASRVDRA